MSEPRMDEENGNNPTPKVPFPLNLVMSGVNEPPKPPTIPPPLKNSSGGSFSPKSSVRNHEKASSSTERSLLDTVSFFIRIVAFILFWGFILDIFVFAVSSLTWVAGGDFFIYCPCKFSSYSHTYYSNVFLCIPNGTICY